MKMRKMALAAVVLAFLAFTTIPANAGEGGMMGKDVWKGHHQMMQDMMEMMRDMMAVMKDMSHAPTTEDKRKLTEMMEKLDRMMKMHGEMMEGKKGKDL